jgi:hypothetical protein
MGIDNIEDCWLPWPVGTAVISSSDENDIHIIGGYFWAKPWEEMDCKINTSDCLPFYIHAKDKNNECKEFEGWDHIQKSSAEGYGTDFKKFRIIPNRPILDVVPTTSFEEKGQGLDYVRAASRIIVFSQIVYKFKKRSMFELIE